MKDGLYTALGVTAVLAGVVAMIFGLDCLAKRSSRSSARERAEERALYESTRDKACERVEFRACLELARAPTSTHYTDQEETVEACQRAARDLCRKEEAPRGRSE